jgi:hypothetical protein
VIGIKGMIIIDILKWVMDIIRKSVKVVDFSRVEVVFLVVNR